MNRKWPEVKFGDFLKTNLRPYTLGPAEDANLIGMRLYGQGPFHRELKSAMQIAKKSHFVVRSGDIIYNKLFAWKGTFGIIPDELDGMFVSDKFPTYKLDREKVYDKYLHWYFRFYRVWEQARLLSTGSAALSKLTLNPPKFLLLTLPTPPLEEQRRVVARIEALAAEIDHARTFRQQAAEEAEALVSSTLRQLTDALDANGSMHNILLSLPRNGWSAKCDNADGGTAVLSLSAVTGFKYRPTEYKRTSLYASEKGHFWLKPGDLLITRSNTPELVGHAAIYDGTPEPCIYPDLMMRLDIKPELALKEFVLYWLMCPRVRAYVTGAAKGTSPTMKKISQGIVSNIPFPTKLSIKEQRRIIAELDELQAEVDLLKALQAQTAIEIDALLPAILDRAFKGELTEAA